jgi:hypothetical protein
MQNYGLTDYQIESAKDKLQFNRDYMRMNGIQLDNKFIPYADFVANSYINADRYVAELQHRAWSIFEYAEDKKLKNIFITLTLPSKWHPKKTFKNKLINNKKFAGRKYICTINKIKFINCHVIQKVPYIEPELDFSQTVDKYTPRNASKELSKMLKRLFDDRGYKDIDKQDRCYFRVTEPHKDGTPHLHISLFVPEDKSERVVKALNRLYPAPMGQVETNVKSPVKYLMKYVLKTLDDLREEDSDITNLTLWYLYHGISRFYTSRTFISLEIYRKLNGMYTLRELTASYNNEIISVQINPETKDIMHIEDEYGVIYVAKPVNWFEKLDTKERTSKRIKFKIVTNLNKKYEFYNATIKQNIPFLEPLIDFDNTIDSNTVVQIDSGFETIYKENISKPIDIIIDGEEFIYFKGNVTKYKKKPYQMTDFELYNYFTRIDIDTVDDKHYLFTRNLLIKRGYDVGEWLKLDAIDELQNEFELEGVF